MVDERSTIRDLINYLLDFNPEAHIVNQLTFCWSDVDDGNADMKSDSPKKDATSVSIYTTYMMLESNTKEIN